ncbi:glycosyltransferase family 1 protein [bacterium]|nr:MAG: glycosyltransferase family 1 protein [bacterium]
MNHTRSALRVLCAPAHYFMDGKEGGSEPLWAHEIVRTVALLSSQVVAVTGYVIAGDLPENVRVVSVGGKRGDNFLSAAIAARFVARYSVAAIREFWMMKPDIVHHVLPFGLGQTFNPLLLFLGDRPFVVGPVQGHSYRAHFEQMSLGGVKTNQGATTRAPLANRIAARLGSILTILNTHLLKRADIVVAITQEAADALPDEIERDKVVIIPPGVDTKRFSIRQERSGERLELLSVGYLLKRKRIDTVLRAVRRLLERDREVRLTMAGDGPEREALMCLATELGIREYVRWLGFIPNSEVGRVYREGDVFVSGSEHEGLATAYLEALSSGLPLVLAENSGSRSIAAMGAPARVVQCGDDEAMCRAIMDLAPDRVAVEKERLVAREFVEGRFDWAVIGERYVEAYQAAIKRRDVGHRARRA